MKKLMLVLVLCTSIFGFAQNEKYKKGNYTATGREKGIQLKLNEDNTYDFSFSKGTYEIKNDTIYFKNKFADDKIFEVEPFFDTNQNSKLILSFNYKSLSYNPENIYLGIKSSTTGEIDYRSFNSLAEENRIRDFYENDDFTEISIDKVDKIYLLAHSRKVQVFEYEIDKSISKLQISYFSNNINNLQLKGYYSKSNQFFITDGRSPVIFSLVNEESILPSKSLNFTNTFEDEEFIERFSDTSNYTIEEVVEANTDYQFKYKIENSLQESIKVVAKTPNKFLVVFYDPKNKNIKTHFENFIAYQEEIVSRNMYDGYNEIYDTYNYYLATEKDKKALNLKTDEAQVVFLNSDNQIIYFTNSTIQDAENELFGYYSDIYNELNKANTFAKIDKVVANKKATQTEIKEAFKLTKDIPSYYPNNYAVDSTAAVVEPVEYNYIKYKENELEKEAVEEAVEEAARAMEAAVDSSANYVDSYYSGIKNKENLYQLKSTKEAVQAKWKQLFQAKKSEKNVDLDFIEIATDELQKIGFSNKLFNENSTELSTFDLEMLDYLIAKQVEVDSTKVSRTVEEEQEYYRYEEKFHLSKRLNNFFSDTMQSQWGNSSIENTIKLFPYYKKFIANQNNNYNSTTQYIDILEENFDSLQDKNELYKAYENFFDSIITNKNSIIESLNDYFEKVEEEDYETNYLNRDWSSFKYQFSNLANSVAWNVVENESNLVLIQKAITWSEASLKVDKESHYYLDTLANLYYKNSQKEKAIQTEEKAIFFAKKSGDYENVEEYENVLERMKSGK